ncbi:MAG: decaprenyl-phosphate phosphoribosyltransferase [bacterium]|jgi:4-hydroxybenzoate polyprenyltransferase
MISDIIKLIRPSHWVKNGVVLAGLIFAGKAETPPLLQNALLAFVAFCLLSSAVYVLNDLVDRKRDRMHPLKKNRPIASGKVSSAKAVIVAVVLAGSGVALALVISQAFLTVALAFLAINIFYTVILKNIVIIDVMTIAAGFVLRAYGGVVAIQVVFSEWLLITTFVLALFLGLGKRRHELTFLQDSAASHRQILEKYSPYLLDQLIGVVTASTVITYFFYTMSREVQDKLHTPYLFVTIPFVIYGIFRYLYLVHKEAQGGSPTTMLLTDLPLLIDVVLWLASVVVILYIL